MKNEWNVHHSPNEVLYYLSASPLPERIKDKKLRYRTIADRGLEDLKKALCEQGITAQR